VAQVKDSAFVYIIVVSYPSLLAKLKLNRLYALLRALKLRISGFIIAAYPLLLAKLRLARVLV